MTKVDTEKYLEFVKGVTSAPSLDWPVCAARLSELEVNGQKLPMNQAEPFIPNFHD